MWVVIVKQGPGGRAALDEPEKTLKVKSVLRGYEEEGESSRFFAPSLSGLPSSSFPVPRSELVSWLSKEMREVDEAAGEAVADSVAATHDAQKMAQDYIPIILDDDVRQKGRAKQKQMMITRGTLLNFWLSPLLTPPCRQLKPMSSAPPRRQLRPQSVRLLNSTVWLSSC